jgi:hypothetical protein
MKQLKPVFLLIVIMAVSISAFAQKVERDANYHFKSESYAVALKLYQKLYDSDTLNATNTYRLGLCHLNSNQEPWKALKYLLKVESQFQGDAQFAFELGKAYLYNYQFDKSIASIQKSMLLESKKSEWLQLCNQWMQMASQAKKQVKHPLDVSFINLGSKLNSEMDELSPVISPDGELLFYTSNQDYDHKFMLYTNNVYYAEVDDGIFEKGRKLAAVNSIDDEFVAGFSLANDKLFVQMAGYEAFQDIMYSDRNRNSFRGKNLLNESINSKSGEFAAYETANADTLYFSSNREGGLGGTDIYYSLKLPTGDWGEPRNCGTNINTPFNEDFPVLSQDGSALYFCSDNPKSMGGFDIFKSAINANTREFSIARQLEYPLNDVFDNTTIAFPTNQRYAYVSALRPDGFGFADIYRVIFNNEDPSVKIIQLKLKTGTNEAMTDLTSLDSTIVVTAFSKGKVVFGTYRYDFSGQQATIALPPGSYTLGIKGTTIEESEFKISIPDIPSGAKIEHRYWLVKVKE